MIRDRDRRRPGRLLRAVGIALLASACGDDPAGAPLTPERPGAEAGPRNVLLITLDTTRADALGVYGQPRDVTPNLDRLAREGTRFANGVGTGPTTLPSHAAIMTGKFPYAHGARSNSGYVLSDANETLAEVLRAKGFATAAEVAAPVIAARTQLDQGFERYRDLDSNDVVRKKITVATAEGERVVEVEERDAADVTRHGVRFLRDHREQPFFLWLHYFDAHQPYSPPPASFRAAGEDPYHGEVHFVDEQIGRVLSQLDGLGLRDRTLVVVIADHGEGLGEHDEATHSYFVWDTTVRVPLLVRGPEIPVGLALDAVVRNIDVAPTILDWLGLPPLADAQGTSLLPLIRGETSDLELFAYGETVDGQLVFGTPILRFVREGRWKYVHRAEPELFDLGVDPGELRNVAAEHPDIVERLRGRLARLLAEAPPPPADTRTRIDAETAAQLEALGYAVGTAPATDGESLELAGPDPATRLEDIVLISEATGFTKSDRHELAAERLRVLRDRNPDSAPILSRLQASLGELGLEDERAPVLERLVALDPGNANAHVKLAQIRFQRGDLAEAERLLVAAVALDPCENGPRATLAYLLGQRGAFDRQLDVLAQGVDECEVSAGFRNSYAYALATHPDAARRDGEAALRIAREITAAPGGERPDYLDTLATAQAETGALDDAVRTATRAVRMLEAAGMGESDAAVEIRAHLESFEQGRPARVH